MRIFLLILFCFSILGINAEEFVNTQKNKKPKVAVVLAGGGAKGFAEIGVLKVLDREGIPVDIVVGTSIGSIVGGLYAVGYTADEIEQKCKEQDWRFVLSDKVQRRYLSPMEQTRKQRYLLTLPMEKKRGLFLPQSVIRGQNVINLFCSLTAQTKSDADFRKDLQKSFACVATDLSTGEKVVLNKGYLPECMYASMAIPAIFEPAKVNGKTLVDGGLVDNFPIDVAKEMGADVIIGIDIREGLLDNVEDIAQMVGQLMTLYDPTQIDEEAKMCDLIIRPDMTGYSVASFYNEAVDSLIARGEKAALQSINQIRELKARYALEPNSNKDTSLKSPEKWHIDKVSFSGQYSLPERSMLRKTNLDVPDSLRAKDIKKAVDKLYGQYSFDKVYYNFEKDSITGEDVLNINLREKKSRNMNLGFRVNSVDMAAILINATINDQTKHFGMLSATAEISSNPELSLTGELHYEHFPHLGITLDGKMMNYNIYNESVRISSSYAYFAKGSVYLKNRFWHSLDLEGGYRLKYYNNSDLSVDAMKDINVSNTNKSALVGQPYVRIGLDTWNDYYFPSKGSIAYAEVSLMDDFIDHKEFTPILQVQTKNVIPLMKRKRLALLIDCYTRMIFSAYNYPFFESNFFGGVEYSTYLPNHIPMYGMNAVNRANDYVMVGHAGLRYRFYKNNYLTGRFNCLYTANDLFDPTKTELILGYALSYAMNTRIGPLEVTFGHSPYSKTLAWGANLGYWF